MIKEDCVLVEYHSNTEVHLTVKPVTDVLFTKYFPLCSAGTVLHYTLFISLEYNIQILLKRVILILKFKINITFKQKYARRLKYIKKISFLNGSQQYTICSNSKACEKQNEK